MFDLLIKELPQVNLGKAHSLKSLLTNPEDENEEKDTWKGLLLLNSSKHILDRVLIAFLKYFDFKTLMLKIRSLNRVFKDFLERETELDLIVPDRVMFYRLLRPPKQGKHAPTIGFTWPRRVNYRICQLANRVHVFMMNEFPEVEKTVNTFARMLFGYDGCGTNKDIFLILDEMSHKRTTQCYNMMKFRKIKYLKLINTQIVGLHVNGLAACAERICFKNVVFMQIYKEPIKTECKYVTLKSCQNLQHLEHTKFFNCHQANLVRCEIMRDNLKIFNESLEVLSIRRTFSVDNIIAKYLALDSPFKRLKILDLSYNQIEWSGLLHLISKGCVFANTIERMSLERNLIITSLMTIISRLQLPKITYLDLNFNQIDWEEDELRNYNYKVVRKIREKKQVGDRLIKIRSVEILLADDLIIKVMSPEDLYKD